MTATIKLTKVGNSTGAVFPKELLALLRVGPGDTLYVSETPDGGVRLTACDPAFEAKMAAAEKIIVKIATFSAFLRSDQQRQG